MSDSTFKTLIVVLASALVFLWHEHNSQAVGRYVPFNPGYTIVDTTTGALYHLSEKDSNGVRSWLRSSSVASNQP